MKFRARELAQTSGIDEVATGLRTSYAVDDDGCFEIPDDELDAGTKRRLEEAGHSPVAEGGPSDAEAGGSTDEDVEQAVEEAEAAGASGEYADMDREELYELYKDKGGPESWNDTDTDFLRRSLAVHDEHGTFPTLGDS